ncbi:RNA polymerase II transcription mediator complex subunit 9-domain-containing protein [Amylocarpus encephaloides]|uniref:Mediator of RNA polymerase II transcription subunit 9 n=1 Tax=Amylocarpus encephaloides TaxID=45428 RepID=A0A9P8C0Q6_9HELO|nr:RNA polymerase II transcription mediator complex subunit 9-domain-containing protein [Amylocarpus encephaloides]
MASPSQQAASTTALEIDAIPVLHALLSRLQPPSNPLTGSAGSPPVATPSESVPGTGPLRAKDIPVATDGMKHKLQKARRDVMALPDIHRSIAEQEDEIRELEEKIAKQGEVLQRLRDAGAATTMAKEMKVKESVDTVMT